MFLTFLPLQVVKNSPAMYFSGKNKDDNKDDYEIVGNGKIKRKKKHKDKKEENFYVKVSDESVSERENGGTGNQAGGKKKTGKKKQTNSG